MTPSIEINLQDKTKNHFKAKNHKNIQWTLLSKMKIQTLGNTICIG